MTRSRTVRRLAAAAAAVGLLPLPAACGTDTGTGSESHASDGEKTTAGSAGQLDIPAAANAGLKKQYLLENAIAARMKKQGFTYTPVAPEDPAASWTTYGADHALPKKYRQKGASSADVAAVACRRPSGGPRAHPRIGRCGSVIVRARSGHTADLASTTVIAQHARSSASRSRGPGGPPPAADPLPACPGRHGTA